MPRIGRLVSLVLAVIAALGGLAWAAGPQRFVLATASESGYYFIFGAGAARAVNKAHPDIFLTAVPTAGSPENIRLLSSDQAQVATVVGSVAYASYFGRGTDKKDDLRMLLAFGNPIGFHFQVPKDSPLKTVYELKGKKVAFGVKGSGDHAMVKHVFEAIGLDMDRDFRAQYLPIREMVDAFKDGKVDGAFKVGPDPQPAVVDMSTGSRGVKLLGLSEEDVQKVTAKFPDYRRFVVPIGWFQGFDYQVVTAATPNLVVVRSKFPADIAYNIVAGIFAGQPELAKSDRHWAVTTPEISAQNLILPLHPGAERFYREKGLLK